MQFLTNGPDIPEALLQAHEDGQVIFFCGAGISYPAGLPGFEGLVDAIYKHIGTTLDPIEKETYKRKQYDATLDLLERRIVGQRAAVRKALADSLRPKLRRKGALDTHEALLQLARCRTGALRLVTTNFDRIFENASKRIKKPFHAYAAPMLPIPKNSKWDGLVYLHGLLPKNPNESELNRLIITSGDFGLAYLIERWAARFVSELFRNYIVCFVGYSINDPILRYMMDALAADRMLGETTPQAYAFGDYKVGGENGTKLEWEAKGVTPILYEVPVDSHDHSALHKTLKAWAEIYRDGILGRERIVIEYAVTKPSASTQQDDFVGRMLWALSDESGLPAKRFAEFNPVPSLDWLDAFSETRYRHNDLIRFGISPCNDTDENLEFSIIHRPSPYRLAPWMSIATSQFFRWDNVMSQLSNWLLRHINDPNLILWLTRQGSVLHPNFIWTISNRLNYLDQLKKENKFEEIEVILLHSPNAIPDDFMKKLWLLFLAGKFKVIHNNYDIYEWQNRVKSEGLTTILRLSLRSLLEPKITVKKYFGWSYGDTEKQIIDWDIELQGDYINCNIKEYISENNKDCLPALLDDFKQLFRDTLDLSQELGGASERHDSSYLILPSISDHWQNQYSQDWAELIVLLRDTWLLFKENNLNLATVIAREWFNIPYPTFKRLAFFAASYDNCISSEEWLDWLLSDSAWWLWSSTTQRETLRLLVKQGIHLSFSGQQRLEMAILSGPPEDMFNNPLDENLLNRTKWLRFVKLQSANIVLGQDASSFMKNISAQYPEWQLASHDIDEFPIWSSGTGDPDFEEKFTIDPVPRKRTKIVQWLKNELQTPSKEIENRSIFHEDNWHKTCMKNPMNTGYALFDLSNENIWPVKRWMFALTAWCTTSSNCRKTWKHFAQLITEMPDDVFNQLAHQITYWLGKVSKAISHWDEKFLSISNRIIESQYTDNIETNKFDISTDPINSAINNPVGQITEILLDIWFKTDPNDNDLLPHELLPLFTRICDSTISQFYLGRVMLASRLIALFRVDREWTITQILPLLNWKNHPTEAGAVWGGFLWSPRIYQPLMIEFKESFLETSHHYEELGTAKNNFARFLTYGALMNIEGYSKDDFHSAILALPSTGLEQSLTTVVQVLGGEKDQNKNYWENRIKPFLHDIWPKSQDIITDNIIRSFTRLNIVSGNSFPDVFKETKYWLRPVNNNHFMIHKLHEESLFLSFPEESLHFMYLIVNKNEFPPSELSKCLLSIATKSPNLRQTKEFQELENYCRRYNLSIE